MDKFSIGNRVRRQRESMTLTRDQFAERIEISPQFLAEVENGTKGMSAETLYKICERANASADYILFGRQCASDIKTPAVEMLCKIPQQYSDIAEDALQVILRTIEKSENNKK